MKKLIVIACVFAIIGLFQSASIIAEEPNDVQIQKYSQKCEIEATEEGVMNDEKKEYIAECVADLMDADAVQEIEPEGAKEKVE